MSNLFGGGAKVASMTPTRAMGIQFMSSQYGPPVPVVYGTGKVGGQCQWYGDFTSTAHSQKTGKGGGGSSNSSYTYSASFMLGLCEGPITSIGTVYDGTSTVSLSSVGAVTATGTAGQAPWSHLSGSAALGYSQTAWIAVQNLQLGSSASLPNWNVEVTGLHPYTGSSDANPADILTDICTDTSHGINFNYLGTLTQYSNYCVATGLLLSPVYDQEQTAQQTLDDLFKFTNSAAYFSEGVLKVVPYGDTAVTGNGVTYTPNNSPLVNLGTADYIVSPGEDPIQITRKAPADAMNMVRVQFQDRTNTYHDSVVVASIDEDVIVNGGRADTTEDVSMCKVAATARFIAQNLVQRSFFIRNTYEFKLGWRYCYLEPMDIVTLTDPNTGLNLWPVRIVDVTEDESGDLSITAEEYPEGVGHSAIYNTQPNNGGSVDPNADPGAVNPPYIFRGPGFLVSNAGPEIWLAINGSNPLWGGADVYLSHDGTSYSYAGTVAQPARYGALATALPTGADPDTTNTPEVTVYAPAQLLGGSQADADNLVTLAMVDTEIVSYETSTLVGTETYQLGYLRRSAYGSAVATHSAGAPFVRLDDAIFRLPIDPSLIGQTVYLKFLSINAFGRTPRTLAGETAYTYVVGTNVELPDVPPVPASFGTQGIADGVNITWNNTNPSAVGCTSIERSTASGGPWTVIAQVGPTTTGYTDHFTSGATYYYRARARGPLVSSGWSAYTSVFNSSGTNVNAISATANTANTLATQAPIINGGFDATPYGTGWTMDSQWTVKSDGLGPGVGPGYAQFTPNGSNGAIYNGGRVGVVTGQTYKTQALIRATAANGDAYARIRWLDATGTEIAHKNGNVITGSVTTGSYAIDQAPSGAVYAATSIEVDSCTTGTYQIDNVVATLQPSTVDEVPDGSTYGRPWLSRLNGGRPWIDFSEAIHANKTQDFVPDGSTYLRSIQLSHAAGALTVDNATFQQSASTGWTVSSGASSYTQSASPSPSIGAQYVVIASGSGGAASITANRVYSCNPGDFVSVGGIVYAFGAVLASVQADFYTGAGAYISSIVASSSGVGWAAIQKSGVVPAAAGRMQLSVQCHSASSFTGVNYVWASINDVRVAGSGARVGDQRNLLQRTITNYPSKVSPGVSYSASAGTPATATISVAAFTALLGSVSVSYNAASASVTGTNGTNVNYYLYFNDPTYGGGTQTLVATTNQNDLYSGDGYVYVGYVTVAFPPSGSGSGGGTGCPLRTAWVIRRGRHGRPQFVRAGKVRVGDWLLRTDVKWAEVTFSRPELQPCVRLVADGFGTLGCSISAPMQLREGSALSIDCLDREVVARAAGVCGHVVVTALRNLGDQWVQHITLANAPDDFFWTGDAKDALFGHHNNKPP